jgi:uncharacterized repeat protein (TIGR03803 family)
MARENRFRLRGLFASAALFVLLILPAWTQTYKVIYAFNGQNKLTAGSSIARDKLGNLYGASYTGTRTCASGTCGAIYKISPTGKEATLHEFSGPPDGNYPNAVIVDSTGTIYGTTYYGGTSTSQYCGGNGTYGCGTIFKLTPSGKYSVLHSFNAPPGDGILPEAGVIASPNGSLYGTTVYGGTGAQGNEWDGTIYEFTSGKETVLYSFTDGVDGGLPSAGLLLHNGALYGTAQFGGTGPCVTTFGGGCGTVFMFDKSVELPLYEFQDGADGASPAASLIADPAGNLYGTTVLGGDLNCNLSPGDPPGCGVAFKLSPTGQETVLHAFTGSTDGTWPSNALVRDAAGNLYGTAYYGGDLQCNYGLGCGTIFKIDSSGNFSVIHTFNGQDGAFPRAIISGGTKLYGVTNGGGPGGLFLTGVIYELTP